MSGAPTDERLAPPWAFLPWPPPTSKWAGRAYFAGLGLAVFIASTLLWTIATPGAPAFVVLPLVVPAIATAVLVGARIRRGPRWRWLSFLAGAAAFPVLLFVVLVGDPAYRRWTNAREFDAIAWTAAASGAGDVRVWMVDDLREREPLEGRTRVQIEALLGPPDFVDPGGLWIDYRLGYEGRFMQLDLVVMRLEFDEERRVVNVQVFEY